MKWQQYIVYTILGFILCTFAQCGEEDPADESVRLDTTLFAPSVRRESIKTKKIEEASGLVVSRSNPLLLWTHNDSQGKSRLFLLDQKGKEQGILKLKGIDARDWEDIAIGDGPKKGINYLYIGNIGDNNAQYNTKFIYRIPEPNVQNNKLPLKKTIKDKDIEVIRFQFPDGKRDAETLMLDPWTKDIYIVSKREEQVKVYVAPYPQSTEKTVTLEEVATLHFSKAVAGDISQDGQEILIKNYGNIYYWKRTKGASIKETLQKPPVRLPYIAEPQGEAIAWKPDASGYFTLSEIRHGSSQNLYFYPRLKKQSK